MARNKMIKIVAIVEVKNSEYSIIRAFKKKEDAMEEAAALKKFLGIKTIVTVRVLDINGYIKEVL